MWSHQHHSATLQLLLKGEICVPASREAGAGGDEICCLKGRQNVTLSLAEERREKQEPGVWVADLSCCTSMYVFDEDSVY